MISEERLCSAANHASEIYTAQLEVGYNREEEHQFTPKFEKEMRHLRRRANHPILHKALRSAAIIVLAFLLAGGTWLTVDAEAREAFVGWIIEIRDDYFVCQFDGDTDSKTERAVYRPGWLPEGYEEFDIDDTSSVACVLYAHENTNMLQFFYTDDLDDAALFINPEGLEPVDAMVNGQKATLLLSHDPDTSSAILWTSEDHIAFCLDAYLEPEQLIDMAESVHAIN